MSPETIDNKSVDGASDLWALGCIIYQLIAGETPFNGGSPYLTFLKVQDGSFDLPDFFSNEAKDIISILLQKQPSKRFGSEVGDYSLLKGNTNSRLCLKCSQHPL